MIIILRCPDVQVEKIPDGLRQFQPVEFDIENETELKDLATIILRGKGCYNQYCFFLLSALVLSTFIF